MDRVIYDNDRKKLPAKSKNLTGDSNDAVTLYHSRYKLLYECLTRNNIFASSGEAENSVKLWSISQLKHDRHDGKKVTFGLLGIGTDVVIWGKYVLEDTNSSIRLDISQAVYASELITLDSFVLVEGYHSDESFIAETIGNPPIPPRDAFLKTDRYISHVNEKVKIIIFSDVWLDRPDLPKVPYLFILCGNFTSQENLSQFFVLTDGLKILSKLKQHYNCFTESHIIIVPGPNDPGLCSFLPRDVIPRSLTETINNLIFTTNPVRCDYEKYLIIGLKFNKNKFWFVVMKFLRKLYATTALSQGHLSPIPLCSRPIPWRHDNALSLYPLPDLVVTAINYPSFVVKEELCTFINPGCYSTNGYNYLEYDMKI
ncbi:hypothetical protein MXB_2254 [Myxobolus squamalis]|nr:hypothetical protein MXB_2254 [Myxobolus squamalis]